MIKERIDSKQFTVLVIMNTLGAAIIYIPSIAARMAKENGWISIVLMVITGLGLILLYNRIITHQDSRGLFHTIEQAIGKRAGWLLSLLFIGFIFMNLWANLWAVGDFLSIQILMETPFEVITFLIILTVGIAVSYGLEVVARTAELFFPFTMLCAILLTFLVLKGASVENLLPVFQLNRTGTFAGILPMVSITFLELFILVGITHTVNEKQAAKRAFFIGGGFSGFILFAITIACILVLGPQGTADSSYPVYALGQRISLFNFIERIEIIVAFIWFFTIFFKLCISFYVLSQGLKYLVKLHNPQIVTIPIALLVFFSGIMAAPNPYASQDFINGPVIILSILAGLILPLIVLIGLRIRKK
ncbi:GerAB/ArcD/ProY family transporter [Gracilibacillus phocaeensis]|uniref:GerAB/ArcD/ProY family transporter n=1 Tax=Gracilibacillus phocaeensis TaxID=2042304 RepID=UPI0010307499|nr:endospore germination permease [Gracilibacillus phocaeensis]